jgi:ubiquinol-cytochrome c reductase cytochrome c subunit
MPRLLAASALLCCALAAAGTLAQPDRTQRAAAANGQSVYMRVGCFTCHGTVGHGGAAPRLAPGTLPLPAFTTWVRNGTPGWSFLTGMPAYPAAVISDADLADVRAFLASLPAPPAPDEIPLLRP